MDNLVGLRVELTQDIAMDCKGDRGIIAKNGGYIGVVFDKRPYATVLSHDGYPITNYVQVVEDEREPEAVQLSLFGD